MAMTIEQAVQEWMNAPAGETWIRIQGRTYHTDVGYATDGVKIIAALCGVNEDEEYEEHKEVQRWRD